MIAYATSGLSDRLLAGLFASLLTATVLMAAAEAHLLCSLLCIHGESGMVPGEICSSASAP
ncbi:hypothetical protein [Sinorhizobium sp. BG8]|uniref:hypothetical protein n=1 Tax=Sinorhizobium sp. BG8 TaxID=2613773 RepID=UPI00193D2284|nr:hypothetical protein [Sinorhizobium sp. BG8]QRM57462.1 hypothetical protein F3Y30_23525 [Sinorhizobium sp. BG8]